MVTFEQAVTAERFHENQGQRSDGSCYVWRRNGATQTWKTRPGEFRIPVKYGMYQYGQIRHDIAEQFHTEADCPFGNI
jgi:hypothetical protein